MKKDKKDKKNEIIDKKSGTFFMEVQFDAVHGVTFFDHITVWQKNDKAATQFQIKSQNTSVILESLRKLITRDVESVKKIERPETNIRRKQNLTKKLMRELIVNLDEDMQMYRNEICCRAENYKEAYAFVDEKHEQLYELIKLL